MRRLALSCTAALALAGGAWAQTDEYVIFSDSPEEAWIIQGGGISDNWVHDQNDLPIAVADTIRALDFSGGTAGSEYALDGTVLQSEAYPPIAGVQGQLLDGTTDGVSSNFTVEWLGAGNVWRTDRDWGNGVAIFNTGQSMVGVTCDSSNGTLWIAEDDTGIITNYALDGTRLAAFSAGAGRWGCLAYEPSTDTLWMVNNPTSEMRQYRKDGTLLTSQFGNSQFGNVWGGEFQKGDPCADCPCREDIDRDGVVAFSDILRILAKWGPCERAPFEGGDVSTTSLGAVGELGPQRREELRLAAGPHDLLGTAPVEDPVVAATEFDYDDASVGSPVATIGGPVVIDLGDVIANSRGPIVLDSTFPGRGWYNDVGLHQASNDNTFTGTVDPDPQSGGGRGLNSFYVYDVSGLSGLEVVSASIRFEQDDYFSQDSAERIEVYDVSTSRADLEADYLRNDPTGITIHDDLQTGAQYGIFTAVPGQGNVYTTELSAQAVADVNAAIGGSGDFAISLHNGTDSLIRQDGVRFDQPVRVHQLILEAIPARDEKWCNGPYDCEIDTCWFSNRNSEVNPFIRYDDFLCEERSLVGDFEFIAGGWLSGPCDLLSNLAAVEINIYEWRQDQTCGWVPGALICSNVVPVNEMDIERFCVDQFGIQQYSFRGRLPDPCQLAPGQYAISIAGVLADRNGCFLCWAATSQPRRCLGYSTDRNTGEGCTSPEDMVFCLDSIDPCELCPCPEDIDGDGQVAFSDILKVLAAWGPCPDAPCSPSFSCERGDILSDFMCDGEGCFCFTRFDGGGFCQVPQPCGDLFPCDRGDCPPGFVCVVDDCCGIEGGGCVTLEAACEDGAAPEYPAGTMTQAGLVLEDGSFLHVEPAESGASNRDAWRGGAGQTAETP